MWERTFDAELVVAAMRRYEAEDIPSEMDVVAWVSNPNNFSLVDNFGNVALFEDCGGQTYSGHYFFLSRGKEAKAQAIEALRLIFERYHAEVVKGLTPLTHKAALYMNGQLGFKKYGETVTPKGLHAVVVLTKAGFTAKHGIKE